MMQIAVTQVIMLAWVMAHLNVERIHIGVFDVGIIFQHVELHQATIIV